MKKTLRHRALRRKDAIITLKLRNLPEVRNYFSGYPFLVNPEKEDK